MLEAEVFAAPLESLEEAAALARLIARMAEEDEEAPPDQLAAATRAIAALLAEEAEHEAEHAEGAGIGSMLHRMQTFERTSAYGCDDARRGRPARINVAAEGESMAPVERMAEAQACEEAAPKARRISAA